MRDKVWLAFAWFAYFFALVVHIGNESADAAYLIGMGCFFLILSRRDDA